jgi:hypothetical protein
MFSLEDALCWDKAVREPSFRVDRDASYALERARRVVGFREG